MCVLLMLLSLSVDMKFANEVFNVHNGGQNFVSTMEGKTRDSSKEWVLIVCYSAHWKIIEPDYYLCL